jgi:integrase
MLTKLTAAEVAAATGPTDSKSAYTLLSDTVDKGFGLRVTRAGAKAYVFSYTTKGGIGRRKTIGDVADWPLPAARKEIKRLRRIVDQGGDPMGDLHELRAAPTVKDLIEKWREEAAPKLRPRTRTEAENLIRLYVLPALGKCKVADDLHDKIEQLHRKITEHGAPGRSNRKTAKRGAPISANRTVSLLSKLFSLAKGWKMRTGDNPAAGIDRNQEVARERFLEGSELIRLVDALRSSGDSQSAHAVMLLLLTGARRGEVLGMQWDQISFEREVWTKPASTTKQKKSHAVPLTAPVMQILSTIREVAEAGPSVYCPDTCPWVFPSRQGNRPVGDIKHAWTTLRKAAEIEGLRVHDLRHAFGTYLASSGLALPIIGRLLGHSQTATTNRYVHAELDPMRAAADKVAARITAAQGGEQAEVVPLTPKGRGRPLRSPGA